MKILIILLTCLTCVIASAQSDKRANTQLPKDFTQESYLNYLNGVKAINIGPTIMSGRVVDIEADPEDPTHFYVAYATGGLWETKNNGTTFESIFNNQSTFGIGDIAVDWKSKRIFVGTGENNSSRSTYAGLGLFSSDDNGKNWTYLGLEQTQHIGRIVLNPSNANEIWVCAIGNLFSYNKERGVYKTSDGGKTWKQTLFINDKTGVIDLVVDPQNAKTLYAAAWQRERAAWNFEESGEGSGIYKSIDGGDTWNLLTGPKSNFPQGKGVGRIGLAVSYQNSNVVYAILDNQDHRESSKDAKKDELTKEELKKMSHDEFLKLPVEKIEKFLRDNEFPEEHTAQSILEKIKSNAIEVKTLVVYLEDSNSLLFDTPVKGAEVYWSEDGGSTWKKTHEGYLDNMVFSYGYYFGQIRVHPKNDNKIYFAAFFVAKSDDGGKTIVNINGDNVHVDHHALWIDANNPGHLINGNDGGVNITYDDGKNWIKPNSPPVGQFYTVAVDNSDDYLVYGGLQDNGVWGGSNNYNSSTEWQMNGKYPYSFVLGGDGMQVQIDLRDNNIIYTGWQFGSYYRINKTTGQEKYITPKHALGESPLRFNWQTPIQLSTHNNDVLYLGANKLYRSFNKGDDFKCISGDLTAAASPAGRQGKQGDVSFGTIATISESPLQFGLIYTGSDDGLVHLTKDGGANWTNITKGLPVGYWVRRVVASAHNVSRVYACLSGHTLDDFQSLLFVSEDYGSTWKQLKSGLPNYPVNVIREDPNNKNLLYVGTDCGLYFSLDAGNTFLPVKNGFPVVPVHDIAIQNREADLIAATHGRSLFKIDLEQLRAITGKEVNGKFTFLPINSIKHSERWGNEKKWYQDTPKSPSVNLYYFSNMESIEIEVTVKDPDSDILFTEKITAKKGLQMFELQLQVAENLARKIDAERSKKNMPRKFTIAGDGKYYFSAQKYRVELFVDGKKYEQILEVKESKK
jgi:photosystem II stability/assembly factor-like uncharacterized protein